MKLLAIDTSSNACSVAVMIGNETHSAHKIAPMQQAQLILPMIKTLLKKTNITLKQLDALAFGCGPGSFTGVRIATSVMQGLGFALDLPLIPISSLAAVAQGAFDDLGWKNLLVAMDARIQEIYAGAYIINAAGLAELIGSEMVSPPQQMIIPNNPVWCGVGSAWEIYKENLSYQPLKVDATRLPKACALLKLAAVKFLQKEWVSAQNAIPTYLRDEVAKKSQ